MYSLGILVDTVFDGVAVLPSVSAISDSVVIPLDR